MRQAGAGSGSSATSPCRWMSRRGLRPGKTIVSVGAEPGDLVPPEPSRVARNGGIARAGTNRWAAGFGNLCHRGAGLHDQPAASARADSSSDPARTGRL
jgi:hypothetical protein